MLSAALKRDVTLEAIERSESPRASNKETSEEYWLDMEGLEHRDTVTDFNLPEGTFFDTAVVHILTKTTLDRLHELYPQGRFEGSQIPAKHRRKSDRRFQRLHRESLAWAHGGYWRTCSHKNRS